MVSVDLVSWFGRGEGPGRRRVALGKQPGGELAVVVFHETAAALTTSGTTSAPPPGTHGGYLSPPKFRIEK